MPDNYKIEGPPRKYELIAENYRLIGIGYKNDWIR
jgi:hypothetical protein